MMIDAIDQLAYEYRGLIVDDEVAEEEPVLQVEMPTPAATEIKESPPTEIMEPLPAEIKGPLTPSMDVTDDFIKSVLEMRQHR